MGLRCVAAVAAALIAAACGGAAAEEAGPVSGATLLSLGAYQPPDDPAKEEDRIFNEWLASTGLLQASAKPVSGGSGSYVGDDSCQWANDGECDDVGLGTGACRAGTDRSDCWRIADGVEDDSCEWANDGECDEPRIGTGACTQATDRTDCGAIAYLRFQDDSCDTAFDDTCNEPGEGDGACDDGTDRADCIGRERPSQISDHFFGRDDRVLLDTAVFPWSVIGVLTDQNGSSCTATLIGESVLATAAHCIEFDSGVDANGTFTTAFGRPGGPVTARVTGYLVSPDREGQRDAENNEGSDWALLRLDQPLGRELGFVGIRAAVDSYGATEAKRMVLSQAGYSWDTGDNLSGNIGCGVVFIGEDNTLAHNCDTTSGDSGSPLMVEEDGTYLIVATDSSFRFRPGSPADYVATRVDAWADLLPAFAAGEIGETITGPAVTK